MILKIEQEKRKEQNHALHPESNEQSNMKTMILSDTREIVTRSAGE